MAEKFFLGFFKSTLEMWGPQYKNDILHELELLSVLQRTT